MSQISNAEAIQKSLADAGLTLPGPAGEPVESFEATVNLEVAYAGKPVELGTSFRSSECEVAPAIAFAPEVRRPIFSSRTEGN
jgi:hypothetical protein